MPSSATAARNASAGTFDGPCCAGARGPEPSAERARSAHESPSVTVITAIDASAKGSRGSASRNATGRYGESAPATPRPTSMSEASQGWLGLGTYLPNNTSGGARSADDVADHRIVNARNSQELPVGA